jgi:polar amino acid transport system permease protein
MSAEDEAAVTTARLAAPATGWWRPHRIALVVAGVLLVVLMAFTMRWGWLPLYGWRIVEGVGVTLLLVVVTGILGLLLAVPIGLVQVTGPLPLRLLARGFCTVIRGTPLLLQLWLLYYGLGSLFPLIPEIRQSWLWPYLREAWPYAVLSLTLSVAGYEGEIMRGAFAGVPRGELEAGRAFGMGRWTLLRRIWLPRAVQRALPTLTGEMVLLLKSTPLVATITVVDVFAVLSRVRQDTFIVYEPLLLLAAIYMILTALLIAALKPIERLVPTPTA